ncbi:Uncharacterised protein [Neisseria flavescens]|nr:DUF4178 domain-containing protein [Neisseria flavescens]SPY01964.1 Uncharacterised protein [Neisseria meningitidis]SPY11392.1 Uncharacterised protein [Neisseria meningitidis]STZ64629.1 Uncharacterised protein [Neisseria flavescens]
MSQTPFFKTDCPSCGAPVEAHSASAVTLVCGYCNSMLVRQDNGVVDSGRDSALLEDFSPLQIGTSGTFVAQRFTLVGRLQVQYDDGAWNEWYALFDDGRAGWLSEAGDLYVMTMPVEVDNPPKFEDTRAGFSELTFQDKHYIASDVRKISLKRAAAQGELPFVLKEDTENRVSDWRCENLFITLDYNNTTPEAFFGRMVNLDDLKLENKRHEDEIKESAGRLKGSIASENCPNCGSSVHWVNGLTSHLNCPSCSSELTVGKDKAELITANAMRTAQQSLFTLPIGSKGRLKKREFYVMGAVIYAETDAQETFDNLFSGANRTLTPEGQWLEYLLYNPTQGFLWLVESDDGWSLSQTQNTWPRLDRNRQPQGCGKLYDYGGKVEVAAGAFYWRIRSGDLNYYSDYRDGQNRKLSAELNTHEMAWSKSVPVDYSEIAEAFSLSSRALHYTAKMAADGIDKSLRIIMTAILVVVNLPALMMDGNSADPFVVIIGAWLLWTMGKEDGDED